MRHTKLLLYLLFFICSFSVYAQTGEKIELVQADALEGGIFKGVEIRKLLGNVVLKQNGTYIYCDSAYQFANRNFVEFFGRIRLTQGDSLTLSGEKGTFDGNKQLARVTGNVVLQDYRMTLSTNVLEYDVAKKLGRYADGGTIIDGENTLASKYGYYNSVSRTISFKKDVKLVNPEYEISTDTLQYQTVSKVAYFFGPTKIKGEKGNLYAEAGSYDTVKKVSQFTKNAALETGEYLLSGESLFYDEKLQYGQAKKNVKMISKKDDLVISGETGQFWRNKGLTLIYGSPVLRTVISMDTIFFSADTLKSVEPIDTLKPKMLYAYHDIKIFKSDLQGKCDSLAFNRSDSMIYLFRRPVLWAERSQITANRMELRLKNSRIYSLDMIGDAFMASIDTLKNYNQIKGRNMTGFFHENKLKKLDVYGNGESVYYALQGDTALTGLNKALCSNMNLRFDSNKIQSISFLVNPEAKFIPPHEITESDKFLKGFSWLIDEKPDRKAVFEKRIPKKLEKIKVVPGKQKKETKSKKTGGK